MLRIPKNKVPLIALDPGSDVGMAVRDERGKIVKCATFSWSKKRDELETAIFSCFKAGMVAVIEEPGKGYWAPPGVSLSHYASSVGGCRVRAQELGRYCSRLGFTVWMVQPTAGMTKRAVNRVMFDAILPDLAGIKMSHHARDAALMADHWGKLADFDRTVQQGKGK